MPRDPDRIRRLWDWPSSPIPVAGGIGIDRPRGEVAESWWSRRFVEALESFGLGGRMERGRRYARAGQLHTLDVEPGVIGARVQGTRRTPYEVTITTAVPTDAQWAAVEQQFQARIGFAARLLAGEVPPELEDVFAAAGVELLPATWSSLRARCDCPDHENPCKHIAAVLYVFADQLDRDPWLLLEWRGGDTERLLGHLLPGAAVDPRLPPWWPLPVGRTRTTLVPPPLPPAEPPGEPAWRALHRLQWIRTALADALSDQAVWDLYDRVYDGETAVDRPAEEGEPFDDR
jgi:uncharacterized Zn finger protein